MDLQLRHLHLDPGLILEGLQGRFQCRVVGF
jgi:hypothetical protein